MTVNSNDLQAPHGGDSTMALRTRPMTVRFLGWLWIVSGTIQIFLGIIALQYISSGVLYTPWYMELLPILFSGIAIILGMGIVYVLIGYGVLRTRRWAWKTGIVMSLISIGFGIVIVYSVIVITPLLSNILSIFSLLVTASITHFVPLRFLPNVAKLGFMVVGIILFTLMMRKSVREYLTSFYETGGSRISTRIVIGVVIGVAIGIAAFGYGYSSGIIGVPAVERSDVPISEDPFALTIQTQTVVEGLGTCGTSFVFAPDKRIFCVEVKSGKVRVIENFQLLQEPLIELDVHFDRDTRDERGLIGITIDPEFERNHYVYLHWTYLGSDDQTYKRVARFTESNNKLTNMTILLDKIPGNWNHNGGPLEFGYDGKLYITTGDARDKEPRAINENAQNMTLLAGKILRINSDGTIPDDNPFPGSPIYTLGHRNVFGIGFDPVTKLPYVTENGQTFCDEVNVLHPGKNYGWPYVVFDECAHDQGLGFIPKSFEASLEGEEGFTKPYIGLTSNVVPTELVFYTGDKYPPEVNNMFFLSYINRELHRVQNPHLNEVLSMKTYEIRFEGEDMLHGLGGRLYNGLLDIEQGPDGYLYVSSFDRIMRLDFNYTNVKTIVSISVRPDAKDEDSRKLTARISDYFGNAVSDVPVEFFESNRMIGSSVSNLEGVAELEYTIGADDDPTIIAKFAGNERYRASSSPPTTSGWTIAADMPTPRDEVRAGAIGSKIYVVGGFEISTTQASNIVEVYDTKTNTWSEVKELPFGLDHVGAATYQGKLYLAGGFRGGLIASDTLFIYDPVTNEWSRGANMPTARGALIAEFIDGILYAVGGLSQTSLAVNEAYDPATDTWTTKAPMPTARDHHASAVVDGKLYVIGGRKGNTLNNYNVNEEYDPMKDKWVTKAPMPTPRGGLTAASLSDSIYVLCGETPSLLFTENEQYIPSLDIWIEQEELPTARHGCSSAEVGGSIYIIGGSQNTGLMEYDPSNKNEVFTPLDWKPLIEN